MLENIRHGTAILALAWASLILPSVLVLAGCVASPPTGKSPDASDPPETMLVSFHVKPGKEVAFQDALARTWVIYRRHKLVFATPHLVVREKDDAGRTRFVQSFTWVNHAAPIIHTGVKSSPSAAVLLSSISNFSAIT